MKPDLIVQEVRETRERLLEETGGDLRAFYQWIKAREEETSNTLLSLPPKAPSASNEAA